MSGRVESDTTYTETAQAITPALLQHTHQEHLRLCKEQCIYSRRCCLAGHHLQLPPIQARVQVLPVGLRGNRNVVHDVQAQRARSPDCWKRWRPQLRWQRARSKCGRVLYMVPTAHYSCYSLYSLRCRALYSPRA